MRELGRAGLPCSYNVGLRAVVAVQWYWIRTSMLLLDRFRPLDLLQQLELTRTLDTNKHIYACRIVVYSVTTPDVLSPWAIQVSRRWRRIICELEQYVIKPYIYIFTCGQLVVPESCSLDNEVPGSLPGFHLGKKVGGGGEAGHGRSARVACPS